jgi:hypothetical protein
LRRLATVASAFSRIGTTRFGYCTRAKSSRLPVKATRFSNILFALPAFCGPTIVARRPPLGSASIVPPSPSSLPVPRFEKLSHE